ncbi:MAG: rhodanese-related sulfurtransferase [Ignavibacteriales bacterium]|nr:rhodanese-related sulfurtransferase [Ignavibacteriaceae bacterium]QOJ27832.1 MAG: rhodanese-related sulfurtransferase [Ignavibacteriales bacterium]
MSNNFRIISFYKFARLDNPESFLEDHLQYCHYHGLKGKVYVSHEGINGNITGRVSAVENYKAYLKHFPQFHDIWFKESECRDYAFKKMHVRLKKELIHMGVDDINPAEGGKRLKPSELVAMYDRGEDFIIVDTRNTYEARIGHFKNAIIPEMENFREWPRVVEELEQYKDKAIVTYCTGGIRCEKATAYMVQKGFKNVYQIDGGILNFIQQYPDTYWQGGMFVFDDRKVVEPNSKEELKYTAVCHHCGTPTAYYINCHNLACDKIFVVCKSCRDEHHHCCSPECEASPHKRPRKYD